MTSGEFVLQLDADHVPLPNILDRLLGYFNDPTVAFVQSPQDFYNTDSFTHVVNDEGRRLWEENRLFFSLIQPGKDRLNAAFFCGSCGVLRRTAFEEIGGFSDADDHRGHGDVDGAPRARVAVVLPRRDARLRAGARRRPRSTTSSGCAGARARCRCCGR